MTTRSIGALLREWRQRRRLTQLDLASMAEVSARHLCFLETGRARPSRDMILRLAETLQVPLRDRNILLDAAGFSCAFSERPLADLKVVLDAIAVVLRGHEPFPAFAIDRHWTLVASNHEFAPFMGEVDPALLQPPVNVLRLTLSPKGLAPRLANYRQWRTHVTDKLRGQIRASGDPVLIELLAELSAFTPPETAVDVERPPVGPEWHKLVVPFQLMTESGILSFFTTTTIFGTPVDITLAEISLESFYPADAATAETIMSMAKLGKSNVRDSGGLDSDTRILPPR